MHRIRRSIALAAVVLVVGVAAAGPAAASQAVAFSVHRGNAGNPDGWHAEVTGNVTFFGTGRKVRVRGTGVYHHSPTDDSTGYTQARQNLTNTNRDPAWAIVTEGACTSDTSVPAITYTCAINRLFQPANQPGHKLAGVWLRVCTYKPGADPCGPVQYRDNPLQG